MSRVKNMEIGKMISETEAKEIAAEAVKDRIDSWDLKHQPGWRSDHAQIEFVSCTLVQEDRRSVYVLKGYSQVEQERSIVYLWGGGDLALVLFLVKIDAETGDILTIDHREHDWKYGYSPSSEEFEHDWTKGVKQGD